MTVRSILEQKGGDVFSILGTEELVTAAKMLSKHHIGALIVDDSAGKHIGIISERDIVRAIAEYGDKALHFNVSKMMTSKVLSCTPQDTVNYVMETMTKHRFRHLPVEQDGELIGIISIGDVVKRRIEQAERETEEILHYIASA